MSDPIPLWVEPCAGSLAVGLRLLGLPRLTGWMGSKAGYAGPILNALRLRPGQGAREVWLADVSDWSYCWEALALPGVAHRAANLIEEWQARYGIASPRQVRALWDDLLPKWKQEGTPPDAEGAARWLVLVVLSAMTRGPAVGPRFGHGDAFQCAESGRAKDGPRYVRILPRLRAWPASGVPLRVWRDARDIPPASAVVMIDPPYSQTAGYEAGDLPRSDVLALADRWHDAGATVAICEHDPIPGWKSVDLTEHRAGPGTRTKSKRVTEWLSVRGLDPVRPPEQLRLW